MANTVIKTCGIVNSCRYFSTTCRLSRFRGQGSSKEWTEILVGRLTLAERKMFQKELRKYRDVTVSAAEPSEPVVTKEITSEQRRLIALAHGLPFIGFGFLDNAIMIVAGEYIDIAFSSMLGFSTMAAAGFGNLISDLAGIGLVGYVEQFTSRLGYKAPELTPEQLDTSTARFSSTVGRTLGITVGCLLGMFPLLLFPAKEQSEADSEKNSQKTDGPSSLPKK